LDHAEETEWLEEVLAMRRMGDLVHKHRTYTDGLEPLFQKSQLIGILSQRDVPEGLEEHLGIPKSTAAYGKKRWRWT
jgi:hypothetical protein